MAFPESQLGGGWDAVGEDESQPLPGGEAACDSQPLPTSNEPVAQFLCLYGTNHGATQQFSLPVRHGEKAYLGRAGASAADPSRRVVLTTSASHGISRDNGWLEYDKVKGVILMPLQRVGFPVFINGALLAHNSSAVVLEDGNEIGFGGSDGGELTETTVRYRCHFRNMPPLEAAMPPPPPMPAARSASAEAGPDPSAEPAERRARGEKSSAGRKRRREETAAASAAPVAAEAPLGGLAAQAALVGSHAALVAPLRAEERRWARRALECAAQCYGLVQEAVHAAAQETQPGGGEAALHVAIARMQHKVGALAGDSARAQKAARSAARTQQQQHARHDHAAQQRNDGGGRGRRRGRGRGRGRGGGGQ